MEDFTITITQEILALSFKNEKQPELICPKCRTHKLVIRDKLVKCFHESCNWVLFRNICGIQLNLLDLETLICKGRTNLLKGMTSKAGKKFDAFIMMNEKGETSFTFPENIKKR